MLNAICVCRDIGVLRQTQVFNSYISPKVILARKRQMQRRIEIH